MNERIAWILRGRKPVSVVVFLNWPLWTMCLALLPRGVASPTESSSGSKELSKVEAPIPRIVEADYIDLSRIGSFSKFRSGEGHDYSDGFESCRSMKHYFRPLTGIDWAKVKIFSPVKGTVVGTHEEWAGTKIEIRCEQFPACTVAIFHLRLLGPLNPKDKVAAGQHLGFHFGKQTFSDIAVSIDTPNGRKLISYFAVLSESIFARYQDRGVRSRDDAIIPKQLRDSDPLSCVEGKFAAPGHIPNWVELNEERQR